jgi:hypothetical protein
LLTEILVYFSIEIYKGIDKNPIYGNAYVKAFLDNEKGRPKIQPGQCRVLTENLPDDITYTHLDFQLLKQRGSNKKHLYFYWNLQSEGYIEDFEREYNNSYKLKYQGMLEALRQNRR